MSAATLLRRRAAGSAHRMATTVRSMYLRHLLATAEQDEAAHLWHAEREPQLARLAANRAAELRIQLIDLEGHHRMHADIAPPPAEAATELGADPPRRSAFTLLVNHLDSLAPGHVWLLAWLLGVVTIGVPAGALIAIACNLLKAAA